jgi:type IV secretion system protein VirB9
MKRNGMAGVTLAFWAASFTIQPAIAEETPKAGVLDTRVRVVDYNEHQVFRLTGVFRSATQIVFGAGEEIVSAALGDTVSWEIAPAENMLFLKPKDAAGPTNLIVVTKRGSMVRTYQFALTARGGSITQNSDTVFQVRFRYPQEEAAIQAASNAKAQYAEALRIEAAVVKMALDASVTQGGRNLNYSVAGPLDLEPSEVTDNGQFTVMRFPRNQPIPAIFVVNEDGSEAIVPYDVRDEFVVIHQLARQFRLRRGNSLLCIWNKAFDRYGSDLSSGTASPDIERVIERGGHDN